MKLLNILKKIIYKNYFILRLKAKVNYINNQKLFLQFSGVSGFYLPYKSRFDIDWRQLVMVSRGLNNWLLEKYTTPQIQLKKSDIVIDCGAFVGGFSIAAAKFGVKKIYSIEPSLKNYDCLKSNITHYNFEDIITPINIGLDINPGRKKLNLSKSGCDDSFLEPDEGDLKSSEIVEVTTLKKLIDDYKINLNNLYLKVEAEGLEPEIILGLGNYLPRVITVDITPERDGKSPEEEIKNNLKKLGYEITTTKRCLFAHNNINYNS